MLGHPGYGLQGRVLSADKNLKGKIRIEFENIHEPENEESKARFAKNAPYYMPHYKIARLLGVSPNIISRITGTIYLQLSPSEEDKNADRARKPKKVNVGLHLKFNKSNEEVPGWSKKMETNWFYSNKTMEIIRRYLEEFPDLFDYLSQHTGPDDLIDEQVFGSDDKERARQLCDFVQSLPCINAERRVVNFVILVS